MRLELTHDDFVGYLRSALHYLYDPVHLRRSPLVDLFGLTRHFDTAKELQSLLTAAIHALKPGEEEAPLSPAWRVYDLLNLQYLRQSNREDVAAQLGISERQLRREQRQALEALAQSLWARVTLLDLSDESAAPEPSRPEGKSAPVVPPTLEENLGWLKENGLDSSTALDEAITSVKILTQPLAGRWGVEVETSVEAELSGLPVPRQLVRNILLTVLSIAIPAAAGRDPAATGRDPAGPGRDVAVRAARVGAKIEITVSAGAGSPPSPLDEKDAASLETARHLAAYIDAALEAPAPASGAAFTAALRLNMPEQICVLVIDDNTDWLEMLKRYSAGSRFRLVGSREGHNARAMVEKHQPALILLDVMMPNTDGWAILNDLRQDPAAANIPIIISTVLPLEGLALSLGANGFLQKPITQDRFLSELERHTAQR